MDLPTLQALVRRSKLLSEDERTYWLNSLPTMKPQAITELEAILGEAETIPLLQSVHDYFELINPNKHPILHPVTA